jgi:hydroxyquinol 1,2-dioxygenase
MIAPTKGDADMPDSIADTNASPDTSAAILAEVLERFSRTSDPRLREIMLSLIRHAHGFVREVKLTWPEWEAAMALFAKGAAVTGKGRNEFIALSDAIGVTMQVLATSQPKPPGATTPTLIGPFFIEDAPAFSNGDDISGGSHGAPLYVSGRVLDTAGRPIQGAMLNVWHSDDRGLYDVQDGFETKGMWGRGQVTADAAGRFSFWTTMPTAYPAPMDAALGDLVRNTTNLHWRPAHLHVAVRTEAADPLTTHLFVRGSAHLDADVAFGVRPELVADFVPHPPGPAPDGRAMAVAFHTLDYDFVLTRDGR